MVMACLSSVSLREQIHWFSLVNSFMLVVFLVAVVAVILMRTLRKDLARYSKDMATDDLVCAPSRECV